MAFRFFPKNPDCSRHFRPVIASVRRDNPMKPKALRDAAKLTGYNQVGDVVYNVCLPLHEYYDGEHPWDSSEGLLALEMVRMTGQLFDSRGTMTQEFESIFSPTDGTYIGGWAKFDDETERRDGICST